MGLNSAGFLFASRKHWRYNPKTCLCKPERRAIDIKLRTIRNSMLGELTGVSATLGRLLTTFVTVEYESSLLYVSEVVASTSSPRFSPLTLPTLPLKIQNSVKFRVKLFALLDKWTLLKLFSIDLRKLRKISLKSVNFLDFDAFNQSCLILTVGDYVYVKETSIDVDIERILFKNADLSETKFNGALNDDLKDLSSFELKGDKLGGDMLQKLDMGSDEGRRTQYTELESFDVDVDRKSADLDKKSVSNTDLDKKSVSNTDLDKKSVSITDLDESDIDSLNGVKDVSNNTLVSSVTESVTKTSPEQIGSDLDTNTASLNNLHSTNSSLNTLHPNSVLPLKSSKSLSNLASPFKIASRDALLSTNDTPTIPVKSFTASNLKLQPSGHSSAKPASLSDLSNGIPSYTFSTLRTLTSLSSSLHELMILKFKSSHNITNILNSRRMESKVAYRSHNHGLDETPTIDGSNTATSAGIDKTLTEGSEITCSIKGEASAELQYHDAGRDRSNFGSKLTGMQSEIISDYIKQISDQIELLESSTFSIKMKISKINHFKEKSLETALTHPHNEIYLYPLIIEEIQSITDVIIQAFDISINIPPRKELLALLYSNLQVDEINAALSLISQLVIILYKVSDNFLIYKLELIENEWWIIDSIAPTPVKYPLFYHFNDNIATNFPFESGLTLLSKNIKYLIERFATLFQDYHDNNHSTPPNFLDDILGSLNYLLLFITARANV